MSSYEIKTMTSKNSIIQLFIVIYTLSPQQHKIPRSKFYIFPFCCQSVDISKYPDCTSVVPIKGCDEGLLVDREGFPGEATSHVRCLRVSCTWCVFLLMSNDDWKTTSSPHSAIVLLLPLEVIPSPTGF